MASRPSRKCKRKREASPAQAKSEPSSEISESDIQLGSTQFVPGPDDAEQLWDAISILDERGNQFLINWAGIDPTTGKQWDPSWTIKTSVTNDLILEWKEKKEKVKSRQNKNKKKASVSRSRDSTRSISAPKDKQRAPSSKPRGRATSRSQPFTSTTPPAPSKTNVTHDGKSDADLDSEQPGLTSMSKRRFAMSETVPTPDSALKDPLTGSEPGPSTPGGRRVARSQPEGARHETKPLQLQAHYPRLHLVVELPLLRRGAKHPPVPPAVEDGPPARKRSKLSDNHFVTSPGVITPPPPATTKQRTTTHSQTGRNASFGSSCPDSQGAAQPTGTRKGAAMSPTTLNSMEEEQEPTATQVKPKRDKRKLSAVKSDWEMRSKTSGRGGGRTQPAPQRQVSSSSLKKLPPGLPPTAPGSDEDSDSEDSAPQRRVSSFRSAKVLPPGLPPTVPNSDEDDDSESTGAVTVNERRKLKSPSVPGRRNKAPSKNVHDSDNTSQNGKGSKSPSSVNSWTPTDEQEHASLAKPASPVAPSTSQPGETDGTRPSKDSHRPSSDELGGAELNARHVSFREPIASLYGSSDDKVVQGRDTRPAAAEGAGERTKGSKLASLTQRYPKGSRTKRYSPLPLLGKEPSSHDAIAALAQVRKDRVRYSAEVAELKARLLEVEVELHGVRDAMVVVVAERDTARRDLESLKSQTHAASISNLSAPTPLGTPNTALRDGHRTVELQNQLNEAQARIAGLEAASQESERVISSLKAQMESLQNISRRANDAAARFGCEARELEAKNKVLESQVKSGVAQARAIGEERAKNLERDLSQARMTVELLQQQARPTDDAVRARAAEHPKLLQRIENIESAWLRLMSTCTGSQ